MILAVALGWFLYWGHAAFLSMGRLNAAEAARSEAEKHLSWTSAAFHEAERRAATQELVLAISWGFFVPLGLLVAGEIVAGIRRINRRHNSK